MQLSQDIDIKVRKSFGDLVKQTQTLCESNLSNPYTFQGKYLVELTEIRTQTITLIHLLFTDSALREKHVKDIENLPGDIEGATKLQGILKALQRIYKIGLLDLRTEIEATTALNYMKLAEQLLGEGVSGQYDYVPAAVLAGAVLEDALRRLCGRQTPPIPTMTNGKHKMLKNLIDELKKSNSVSVVTAKQLEVWTTIRNSAAHGQFDDFKREDVEQMIKGIENFLAENR